MPEQCVEHAAEHESGNARRCHGTERYVTSTERHASKTPVENFSSHIAGPVDNSELERRGIDPSPGRPRGWTLADEALAEFLHGFEKSKPRRAALGKEKRKSYPIKHVLAQQYEDETEQLRRVIVVERARWFAEQERNAA